MGLKQSLAFRICTGIRPDPMPSAVGWKVLLPLPVLAASNCTCLMRFRVISFHLGWPNQSVTTIKENTKHSRADKSLLPNWRPLVPAHCAIKQLKTANEFVVCRCLEDTAASISPRKVTLVFYGENILIVNWRATDASNYCMPGKKHP